jgi:hypothetical protein
MDNMGTGIMYSEGTSNDLGTVFTLQGQAPDPVRSTFRAMKQTLRMEDVDHWVAEHFETRDGKEVKTFEVAYARR